MYTLKLRDSEYYGFFKIADIINPGNQELATRLYLTTEGILLLPLKKKLSPNMLDVINSSARALLRAWNDDSAHSARILDMPRSCKGKVAYRFVSLDQIGSFRPVEFLDEDGKVVAIISTPIYSDSPILRLIGELTSEFVETLNQAMKYFYKTRLEEKRYLSTPSYFFDGNYEATQENWFNQLSERTGRINLKTDLGWIVAEVAGDSEHPGIFLYTQQELNGPEKTACLLEQYGDRLSLKVWENDTGDADYDRDYTILERKDFHAYLDIYPKDLDALVDQKTKERTHVFSWNVAFEDGVCGEYQIGYYTGRQTFFDELTLSNGISLPRSGLDILGCTTEQEISPKKDGKFYHLHVTIHALDRITVEDLTDDLLADAADFIGNNRKLFNASREDTRKIGSNRSFRSNLRAILSNMEDEEFNKLAALKQEERADFVWEKFHNWSYGD